MASLASAHHTAGIHSMPAPFCQSRAANPPVHDCRVWLRQHELQVKALLDQTVHRLPVTPVGEAASQRVKRLRREGRCGEAGRQGGMAAGRQCCLPRIIAWLVCTPPPCAPRAHPIPIRPSPASRPAACLAEPGATGAAPRCSSPALQLPCLPERNARSTCSIVGGPKTVAAAQAPGRPARLPRNHPGPQPTATMFAQHSHMQRIKGRHAKPRDDGLGATLCLQEVCHDMPRVCSCWVLQCACMQPASPLHGPHGPASQTRPRSVHARLSACPKATAARPLHRSAALTSSNIRSIWPDAQ